MKNIFVTKFMRYIVCINRGGWFEAEIGAWCNNPNI